MNPISETKRPEENRPSAGSGQAPRGIPTVSAIPVKGEILEMVYQPEQRQTWFARWKDGELSYEAEHLLPDGERLVPYSAKNNLIQNDVVLLPSQAEEYGSEEELLGRIQGFLHRYVDLTPFYEKIASYYVLFSWVYDSFNELPYLRFRGEPGSGKTRALLTIGSLCYKPIFASGASSTSPLFRILEAFRGTLVVDESDFRFSDEKAELTKILNNGNVRGFPVLRSELSPATKEFNPRAYAVFGPKLVATRGFFEDRALESRFLTEDMGQHRLRENIPINLPAEHKEEALHLRNQLLLFRFRNLHKRLPQESLVDRSIEPRLNQIFVPLLSIIDDSQARTDLRELARTYNRQMVADRGMDSEAQVLEIIRELSEKPDARLSIVEIATAFAEKHGQEYDRRISPKWIGHLLRAKLGLKPQRIHGSFILPLTEQANLSRLYERYGLVSDQTPPPLQSP